ncbi:hypothetical protein AB1Y20_020536 [Prymnesium parvum]|uniref:L-Fucosyltransferase n=1 Tax=Prymnesium parvum TaxID=97485 RepID=A0AB34JXP5_PRYPA
MEARWLLKDVDYFAGLAHAIHTYLSGVALASRHGMSLLHQPFQSAHGMSFTFDDFLAADPRGLIPPLVAPLLTVNASGARAIDGIPVSSIAIARRGASALSIRNRLIAAPNHSIFMVRKGRGAIVDTDQCNCSYGPEVREAGLWLRERFWQAVRVHELAEAQGRHNVTRGRREGITRGTNVGRAAKAHRGRKVSEDRSPAADPPPRAVPPIVISVHVRRGDVTYLDRLGLPSSRWVETSAVLDVLRGIREKIGLELTPPRVHVHLHSERKGWLSNDTAALLAVAPGAELHLDSSPAETITAIVQMARSDIFVMGSSGFSAWAGLLSCGLKIGPAFTPPLPMRHVNYSSTLRRHYGPFLSFAGSEFSRVWTEYWGCKTSLTCRPRLCAPSHITHPLWRSSKLSQQLIANSVQ